MDITQKNTLEPKKLKGVGYLTVRSNISKLFFSNFSVGSQYQYCAVRQYGDSDTLLIIFIHIP